MAANQTPEFRDFDNTEVIRNNIFNRVLSAVKNRPPLENDRYRLEVENPHYANAKDYSYDEQRKALMSGADLSWKLKGTWKLVDKTTNQVVDQKESTIANVPWMSQRGTFISGSNEYTVAHQMRLRPGIYARKKETGDIEAHFNLLPGTGSSFRVYMEPATGLFKVKVGQANIPLYPILQKMGVQDSAMERYWGKDLLNVNRQKAGDIKAFNTAYERFVNKPAANDEEKIKIFTDELKRMTMDPYVVRNSISKYYMRNK